MSTPYPRHNESFFSWDLRCKDAERETKRFYREMESKSSNWGGYNYRPVLRDCEYITPEGRKLKAAKVTSSFSRGEAVRKFAEKRGLKFESFVWGRGMTQRTDNVAYYSA